ncbi:hypothetical protein ACSMXM_05300 [Pacificimonas sp. ICDLI1SI03]
MAAEILNFTIQKGATSTSTEPPFIFSPASEALATALGLITLEWAHFEQVHDGLISALVDFNGSHIPRWERRAFNKRQELLKNEWLSFCAGHDGLKPEIKNINQDIAPAKYFRDCLSHKQLVVIHSEKGNCVKFRNLSGVRPYTKSYSFDDFEKFRACLAKNKGRISRLYDGEYQLPFACDDISHVRQLVGKGNRYPPT